MPASQTYKLTHEFPNGIQPADLQTSSTAIKDRHILPVSRFTGLTLLQICLDITAPAGEVAKPKLRIYIKDELLGNKLCKGKPIELKNIDGTDLEVPATQTMVIALEPIFVGNRDAAVAIEDCQTDTIIYVSVERIAWVKA